MISKFTRLRYYIKTKRGIILMSKNLLAATLVTGAVLVTAPLVGISAETPTSVATKQAVEESNGFMEKAKEVFGGAAEQSKELWKSVWGTEQRLERMAAENQRLKERVLSLEDQVVQKKFVSGLELERATTCVQTLNRFLSTQVSAGGEK